MKLNAEHYYVAATERMQEARRIYDAGKSYALAMYCGGVAVECILRAFRWLRDDTFDGHHQLEVLLKASGFLGLSAHRQQSRRVSDERIEELHLKLRAAVSEVAVLWHNNLRYASEARLRAHLRQLGRVRGALGNPLKKNAKELLEAAQTIVDQGVALWTFGKN